MNVSCCFRLTGEQSSEELASGCWENWFWQGYRATFNRNSWQTKHERWLFASLRKAVCS